MCVSIQLKLVSPRCDLVYHLTRSVRPNGRYKAPRLACLSSAATCLPKVAHCIITVGRSVGRLVGRSAGRPVRQLPLSDYNSHAEHVSLKTETTLTARLAGCLMMFKEAVARSG